MILRNLWRTPARLAVTVTGCLIAAFVTCFFLAAQQSMERMTDAASRDANLVVRQKDRY